MNREKYLENPTAPRNQVWYVLALAGVAPLVSIGAGVVLFLVGIRRLFEEPSNVLWIFFFIYGIGAIPAVLGASILYGVHRLAPFWFNRIGAVRLGCLIGAISIVASGLVHLPLVTMTVFQVCFFIVVGATSGAFAAQAYLEFLQGHWLWFGRLSVCLSLAVIGGVILLFVV